MSSETSPLSEELSLLVKAALRGEPDLPLLKSKGKNINWDALFQLANSHRVSSLLHDFLYEHEDRYRYPKLNELKDDGVQSAVYYMIFLKKSADLIGALQTAGIDAFLMKGALWAQLLYEKPGLREFGDIDFFVRQTDIDRALAVFQKSGYQTDHYRQFLLSDKSVARRYFETDYQLPLIPVEAGEIVRSVEIQWKSTYPRFEYLFGWEQLMNRRMSLQLLGKEIEIPAAENQLIMMIVHHAGVEQWDKLKYLADFVRLLRKFGDSLDWAYITDVTRSKGFYKLLLQSLGLVRVVTGEDYGRFLDGGLPLTFPSEKFTKQTFTHWENIRSKPMTKSWRIFYFNMMYRDNLRTKLSILVRHAGYSLQWKLLIPKARWYFQRKN